MYVGFHLIFNPSSRVSRRGRPPRQNVASEGLRAVRAAGRPRARNRTANEGPNDACRVAGASLSARRAFVRHEAAANQRVGLGDDTATLGLLLRLWL